MRLGFATWEYDIVWLFLFRMVIHISVSSHLQSWWTPMNHRFTSYVDSKYGVFHGFSKGFPWFSTSIGHPVATPSVFFQAGQSCWRPSSTLGAGVVGTTSGCWPPGFWSQEGETWPKRAPEMSRAPWGVDRILLMLIDAKKQIEGQMNDLVSWGIGISTGMTFFCGFLEKGNAISSGFNPNGLPVLTPKELSRKSHPSEGAIETFHPANEGSVWGTLHSVIWYLHIPTMVDWFLNLSPRHQHVTDLCDGCRSFWFRLGWLGPQ